MNLDRSPEQEALGEALDRCSASCRTPERVWEVEGNGGFDADLWAALGDLDVPAMALPEDAGGGATMVDLAVVAERCGAHLATARSG